MISDSPIIPFNDDSPISQFFNDYIKDASKIISELYFLFGEKKISDIDGLYYAVKLKDKIYYLKQYNLIIENKNNLLYINNKNS